MNILLWIFNQIKKTIFITRSLICKTYSLKKISNSCIPKLHYFTIENKKKNVLKTKKKKTFFNISHREFSIWVSEIKKISSNFLKHGWLWNLFLGVIPQIGWEVYYGVSANDASLTDMTAANAAGNWNPYSTSGKSRSGHRQTYRYCVFAELPCSR